jgi:hypothetical protein
MTDIEPLIIRTSDRGQFKRCRQLWDFTSIMRGNYQYAPGVEPLDFGTAIHSGLEAYYDPTTWDGPPEIKQQLCLVAFKTSMNRWRERIRATNMWETMGATFEEHWNLGIGMLEHYFLWAPHEDRNYRPVRVEAEFEVPVPVLWHSNLPERFRVSPHEQVLQYRTDPSTQLGEWVPVVYQGRIDLIFQDLRDGSLWIYDHKTAAQFGQTEHLELDQQCGSYVWACKKILGLDVAGVIYGELRKKAPKDPDILQSGLPSKNKSQSTTPEMYRAYLREKGIPEEPYQDFLQSLANDGQQYFRRIEVHRSDGEMAALEANIVNESIDMIDNPRIYPNPSRWNCNGCKFRTPCLLVQEGQDASWFLEHSNLYEKRTKGDVPVDVGPAS